tara:strand:+ start:11596 stop:12165 length:570 start_codon:yes stop_codon:yes gene_type:complete
MNYLLLLIVALVVWALSQRDTNEKYQELFGFAGYQKPVNQVILDDPVVDTSDYTEVEAVVDHDLMEKLVLNTNEEIAKRTDDCSYIIETTAVKKFEKEGQGDLYKCMFMCVRTKSFAFGFTVVSTVSVRGDDVKVLSLRTQPLNVDVPEDVSAYTQDVAKEFLDFNIVKETVVPKMSELDAAKEKLKYM